MLSKDQLDPPEDGDVEHVVDNASRQNGEAELQNVNLLTWSKTIKPKKSA